MRFSPTSRLPSLDLVVLCSVMVALILVLSWDGTTSARQVSEVEIHLKDACAAAWPLGTKARVNQCVARAMAAMGDENRMRDNELKHLLMVCEKELRACDEAAP